MTARILVVDDIEANVRLLEARLMAEYFQVLTGDLLEKFNKHEEKIDKHIAEVQQKVGSFIRENT